MDNYFNSYREMISLRGLTDHTLKNYCTYIRAYLDYLQHILYKDPGDVSWQNSGISSNGSRLIAAFLTVQSTLPSPSSVSLPCMSCTDHGMTLSFLCVNLIPICLLFPLTWKPLNLYLPFAFCINTCHFSAFEGVFGRYNILCCVFV